MRGPGAMPCDAHEQLGELWSVARHENARGWAVVERALPNAGIAFPQGGALGALRAATETVDATWAASCPSATLGRDGGFSALGTAVYHGGST